MELEEIPLTANGKADKKSLPSPDLSALIETAYVVPRNGLEKIVSEMWKNLLHVRKIGVNDNFFELGGNSLLAQNFITLLAKEKYLLPITKLYQHPTPARIAAFLEGKSTTKELEDTRKHSQTNDIAVIAMAGRFPGADTIDELWTNLKEGKESIRFFSEEEID